ncbi:hypothetical protein GW915_09380 [bacterium]|nr:hypothetical protein [bacterium]
MHQFINKPLFLFLSCSFLGLSQAKEAPRANGYLSELAYEVASEVDLAEYRLSPSQKQEIARNLNDILRSLDGRGRPPREQTRLVCVSRDDDGRAPYMIGVKEDLVTIKKVSKTVIQDKEDCEQIVEKARLARMGTLVCGTRDNDGRSPFILLLLDTKNAVARSLAYSATSSKEQCLAQLNDAVIYRESFGFCGSRDNDGRAPWSIVLVDKDGQTRKGNDTYSSYEECANNI